MIMIIAMNLWKDTLCKNHIMRTQDILICRSIYADCNVYIYNLSLWSLFFYLQLIMNSSRLCAQEILSLCTSS